MYHVPSGCGRSSLHIFLFIVTHVFHVTPLYPWSVIDLQNIVWLVTRCFPPTLLTSLWPVGVKFYKPAFLFMWLRYLKFSVLILSIRFLFSSIFFKTPSLITYTANDFLNIHIILKWEDIVEVIFTYMRTVIKLQSISISFWF